MFGGLAFLHRGRMFVGVSGCHLMARVGRENYQVCLALQHVREMDFTGKPMRGYVYVDAAGLGTEHQLGSWLGRCRAYAITLPEKRVNGP